MIRRICIHRLVLRSPKGEGGFTLIEVLVVATLIAILAAAVMPQYKKSIRSTKEATLKKNLFILRDVIDQYYADKGQYPGTLETLVDERYVRKIPRDPITGADDWELIYEELTVEDAPEAIPGIFDVRSSSPQQALDGSYYNEW